MDRVVWVCTRGHSGLVLDCFRFPPSHDTGVDGGTMALAFSTTGREISDSISFAGLGFPVELYGGDVAPSETRTKMV